MSEEVKDNIGVSTTPAEDEEMLDLEQIPVESELDDIETLEDEQDIIDNEEDIRRLSKQIKTRKIAAAVFFALSVICLVARLIAL